MDAAGIGALAAAYATAPDLQSTLVFCHARHAVARQLVTGGVPVSAIPPAVER